ncbi:bacillithiol system redox-active protein YtxJ [Desertibacillus haloalkaliphilus]|uniref:bacillithiol system redox-active protein YtxJ n=1 Tax=Desertibacillus haloalkaliphilus TaxID=1328930 RepID=UPI001C25E329|nr:bacillithiol system redox-active protein YtxJ [Desertibacillus haloalkaliphilus]MBU8905219.1 bacillithiol system redox-active protein YtxJ [Desertibacillus haloalkaliphilus]
MALKKVDTYDAFSEVLKSQQKVFLLKNSTTCPISENAFEEFQNFAEDNQDTDFYYLNVQEARPLSNQIADEFEIKHESPQALLFVDQNVAYDKSHWDVTYATLQELWSK